MTSKISKKLMEVAIQRRPSAIAKRGKANNASSPCIVGGFGKTRNREKEGA
jgi:hypothetical protein